MDVFDYRTNRSVNTDGLFTMLKTDTEIGGLFLRLKNLMVSELHLDWDIVFLDQYSKERMVPRGLRWNIFPQQGDPELDSWFRYFNEAGISLLGFLIDKKRSRMSVIDKEIKEIKEKLAPHKSTSEYISHSTSLKNHLEKEEREQKIKKQKKYTRDINDYRNGSVFSWQTKDDTPSGEVPPLMDISCQLECPPQHQQNISSTQERGGAAHQGYGTNRLATLPYTPTSNRKGPPPNNRGRGKNMRGKGRGYRDPSWNHDQYGPDRSPWRKGQYQERQYDQRDYYYPQRTPIRTYNRYSPLREDRSRDYNPHFPYRQNDPTHYDRSPFSYNQQQPGPSSSAGFPKEPERYKRSIEPNVGPEGGGIPEKRKRT